MRIDKLTSKFQMALGEAQSLAADDKQRAEEVARTRQIITSDCR